MKYLLPLLLLCACRDPRPLKEYTATFTKDHLVGKDEVHVFDRVTSVRKEGWLNSNRYEIHTADDQYYVLIGMWEIEMVETKEETNGN